MTIRRLTLVPLALALAAASALASACSGPGGERPAAAQLARPTGVVTVAQAKDLLKRWDAGVERAELAGGTDYGAVEAGLAARIDKANSRLRGMLGESVRTSHAAIVKPRFAIPAKGAANPPWFMADFARKGEKGWNQLIFQQTSGGWKVVAVSGTTSGARPPVAARDEHGLATVPAGGERGGLAASPQEIVRAHARVEATLDQDERARRLFRSDAMPRRLGRAKLALREKARGQWTMTRQCRPASGPYALKTAAGGALVWYGVTSKERFVARPGAGQLSFTDRPTAAVTHGRRYTKRVTVSSAAFYLAVVPKSGPIRVPSETAGYLGSTGS
ncbi:hypothetical protein [Nonomuraea fuscirosea]|uniref:hypothetical protein n=1 Tax=Nonomuraea fuscirosea TaxID=1291556 RepID=UPI0034053917